MVSDVTPSGSGEAYNEVLFDREGSPWREMKTPVVHFRSFSGSDEGDEMRNFCDERLLLEVCSFEGARDA